MKYEISYYNKQGHFVMKESLQVTKKMQAHRLAVMAVVLNKDLHSYRVTDAQS